MDNSQSKKDIHKIVITGGPCAGKTSSLEIIRNEFEPKGYKVFSVDETATQLFKSGAPCRSTQNKQEYQYRLAKLMLDKEDAIAGLASTYKEDKILIVCDRGALDNRVYVDDQQFNYLLKKLKTTEEKLRNRYDAVFHLVTAANGAKESYNYINNEHRLETPEEAILLDTQLITAWNGHPHIRVIDNKTDFAGKMRILMQEIAYFLGEPKTVKTRKKYLITLPDLRQLEQRHKYRHVEIHQAYLKSDIPGEIIRLRQRGFDGSYTYYKTIRRTFEGQRIEKEERLTRREYLDLLKQADPNYRRIKKDRYYLSENGLYYSIDVFPQWKNQALMEIEVYNAYNNVDMPDGIEVIQEVSGMEEYTNPYLARIKK